MSLLAPAEICLVDHLTANDIDLPPVRLVDVGCSGGIYPAWRRWRDRLSALGIDVITDEVERLSQGETNPNVHYIAARAGRNAPAEKTERFCSTTYALHRSQAYFATALLRAKS